MGGGGGSDDYSARAAETEARKAQARNALNVLFGVAPAASTQTQQGGGVGRSIFDAATDREADPEALALAQSSSLSDEAARNKTAREAIYQKVRDDAFAAGKRGFDERRDVAKRQNRFALFAQGLAGGSEDVDQNAMLQRAYNEGVLQLGAKADAAKTDMMSNDEQTRLGLLQSIDAGMDEGSAVSSALGQLKVNSDRAAAQAQGTAVGDLFADAGLLYTQSQAAKGRRDAMARYGSLFPRPASSSGSRGAAGTITSTGGP